MHTVGALPITTQGNRTTAGIHSPQTLTNVHTHDPRLCGSRSGGVIPGRATSQG